MTEVSNSMNTKSRYVNRALAFNGLNLLHKELRLVRRRRYVEMCRVDDVRDMILSLPDEDVKTRSQINRAVDEALKLLNTVKPAMPYSTYSDLFDAIAAIYDCGDNEMIDATPMREEAEGGTDDHE